MGRVYNEEEVVYSTVRGLIRKKFITEKIEEFKGSLLDIGCGEGLYLNVYPNTPKFGMDISTDLLKKACKKNPNGYFITGDAEKLTFLRPESVDNILCTEVIEHLIAPEKLADEITRILKPGGLVLISSPNFKKNRPDWVQINGVLNNLNLEGVNGTYFHTAYSPDELLDFFDKYRFNLVESGTFEKEIKIISKIPALFKILIDGTNNLIFRSNKIEMYSEKIFQALSLGIYYVLKPVLRILKNYVSVGVRSYVMLEKKRRIK